ncbi:hypothetical protein V0R52_12670 [Pseudomonas asiatica]|uniref:hypothetical protein n=1 Tax=Pseudomonas TaxID=286 RepID=UPI002552B2AE|nr:MULTISPECIES: hypothetical protein [Pseudomonas]MDM9552982.1 hypothetical protein [Pseudomonas asiatica]MEE1917250.1 hypothetical protein [Pseudomonas asiatica]WIV23059.1 hypothetical protein QN085_20645 [Pseudomonas sp. M2(2023)]
MANELDLYGPGDLAPYSPGGLQPLAPAPSADWNSGNDLLPTDYHAPGEGQVQVFGQPLPPGVTLEQVMQGYTQLGGVFVGDMMKLRHNITHSQLAVKWFMDSITKTPARQAAHHRYNLYEHVNDPIFQAFANYAHDHGFSQKLVTDTAWWVTTMGRKLAAQNPGSQHGTPPRMAQSKDPTDSLTDAQFEAVVKANDTAKASTQTYLENLWGQSYQQNIKLVDSYYQSLPLNEQLALDKYTTGWIRGTNTREVLLFLFKQAIGAGSLPSGGGNIQAEINQCELVMRTNRKAWLADNQLQARYRHLLTLRDGG